MVSNLGLLPENYNNSIDKYLESIREHYNRLEKTVLQNSGDSLEECFKKLKENTDICRLCIVSILELSTIYPNDFLRFQSQVHNL